MHTQIKLAFGLTALSLAVPFVSGCAPNAPATATAATAKNVAASAHQEPHADGAHEEHAHEHGAAEHGAAEHGAAEHGGAGHASEGGHTHTTKMLVSMQPAAPQAGKTAKWTLKIVDDIDNAPISDFQTVHDKLLHLIVVSKDLNWFNHLHPAYKGKGVFEIEAALPRAGDYKLYADYRPKERDGEVAQYTFSVGGAKPLPATPRLVADTLRGAWITKTVASAPEGEPDKSGTARYQVALMPMPAKITAKQDVMLHFQVRDASGKPVKLQPYLGAQGHLVLLSQDSNTYLHTHPVDGKAGHEDMNHGAMDHGAMNKNATGGSDVMFHTQFPSAGLYKAWGQFRHNDRIITAPFVLNIGAAKTSAAKTGAAKTGAQYGRNPMPVKTAANSVQRATVVVDGGYAPAKLNVRAGRPVEITFVRREKSGCGDVVQIPALGLKTRSLQPGEKATLAFTPKTAQTLRFTCGMKMYDGAIEVKE